MYLHSAKVFFARTYSTHLTQENSSHQNLAALALAFAGSK